MNTQHDEIEIITAVELSLRLNPFKWLKAVGGALWVAFTTPMRVLRTINSALAILWHFNLNAPVHALDKLIVTFCTLFMVLFYTVPKVILYPIVKLALCCILVEFNIRKYVNPIPKGGQSAFLDDDGNPKLNINDIVDGKTPFKPMEDDNEVK